MGDRCVTMIHAGPSRTVAGAAATDAPPDDVLAVEYTLMPEEVAEYFRHVHASRRRLRVTMTTIVAVAAAVLLWAGLARLHGPIGSPGHGIGMFLVLAGPICLWGLWHGRRTLPARIVTQMIKRQRAGDLFDPIRATFGPDGLLIEATRVRTNWRWNAFRGIEHHAELTFLYLSDLQAVIIPDRAFPDEATRMSMVAAADAWRAAAPLYERECPECSYDLRGTTERRCPEGGWTESSDAGAAAA